jgi:hypothetical protein
MKIFKRKVSKIEIIERRRRKRKSTLGKRNLEE